MPNLPLYHWDTCIFLAWLQDEDRGPEENAGISEIVHHVLKKEARMVTSAILKSEILSGSLSDDARIKLDGVLKQRNVMVAETNDRIWRIAHDIRDHYRELGKKDGLPTVTTPDAIHLATAIHYDAEAFYTFDERDQKGKRRGLLPLSGNVAGHILIIKKPLAKQTNLRLGK